MWCVINGVHSYGIKGLQILSLPPVKLPPMRTMIDTIDGRPGDIVTELGYAAYDKEMRIGLVNDYDEDEIISYFSQSGTITFSNEPDKYYKFRMVDELEMERFNHFRQATVTFHVQPYKYPVDEKAREFTDNFVTITNRGNAPAAPRYTFEGSGRFNLLIDGLVKARVTMPENPITIDVDALEATSDGLYANRYVEGDYDDLILTPGKHTITWSNQILGEQVTKLTIENYTRWK